MSAPEMNGLGSRKPKAFIASRLCRRGSVIIS